MLDLSRWGMMELAAADSLVVQQKAIAWDGGRAANTAKSGRTVSVPIPSPHEDPIIQAIEERCAAATGMPIHRDEEPLGVRHTSPSTAAEYDERRCTALHIDTNQGGIYRCATVLIYLHDIDRGGETRFPLVGMAEPSELREAARQLCGYGATAFSPDPNVEWPPIGPRRKLLDAAEVEQGQGLHVRPRKGLAAVFWTHTTEGLDQYSWHAGARLPPECGGGKLIAQKFKSLPVEWRPEPQRGGGAVKLPKEFQVH